MNKKKRPPKYRGFPCREKIGKNDRKAPKNRLYFKVFRLYSEILEMYSKVLILSSFILRLY